MEALGANPMALWRSAALHIRAQCTHPCCGVAVSGARLSRCRCPLPTAMTGSTANSTSSRWKLS
eukprot:7606109-Alexandrium_andersonii.AAC.1